MAERCAHCRGKISNNDEFICPVCGLQYHKYCADTFVAKCKKCGESFFDLTTDERQQEMEEKKIEIEKQRQESDARRLAEEQARQKAEQERYQARINHLKALGKEGYYEYKAISIVDRRGAVDTERLMRELNDLGLDGWRLQCAYTNEMGKDALSVAGFGINSTADQNILIFERFVKFE